MTPEHNPAEIERVARGLTKAQRDKLNDAVWYGSGVTQFACVECLGSDLPPMLAHMFTLRWDRLTPLGLAVRTYLIQQGDTRARGEG